MGAQFVRRSDALDAYSPDDTVPATEIREDAPPTQIHNGEGPWAARGALTQALRLDGYQNHLTGIGDPARDKTYGGHWNGPDFRNQFLTGWEAQERWRGSDLGGRIIETIPREMVRKGWKIDIQPDPDDTAPRRDDFPDAAPAAPTHDPGPLPETSDDSTALIEALGKEQEHLGLAAALELALCYERNYGGGAIFLGVDDGETDLTKPLDWKKVRRIKHLTTFRGGWDGELIAWRYYVNPTEPRYGKPVIFQLRNLGVPISSPPAPGEGVNVATAQPPGALIFYVHESRFLLFDGDPKSHWAAVQMRGWGDGVWMRINQVLSQYCQSWEGVAILMQELGTPILQMEDFAKFMSAQDGSGLQTVTNRAIAMQMAMSIAKVRILDSKENMTRLDVQLAGVAEVLREFALRISAAAGMPFSMLMGQVQGGLGDASKGDISFFDDQVIGLQAKKLTPALQRFIGLQFAASEGVARGKTPSRWSVAPLPQREMTSAEKAKYKLDIATADEKMIENGVVTPEEVASTRYGSSEFNDGPIVLDLETRAAMKAQEPSEPIDAPAIPEPSAAPTTDSASFITRGGRTRLRTAVSKVAVFRASDGLMLWGKRADTGKFDVPGGHQDGGEDALSCAMRELHEETGLRPKQIRLIGAKSIGSGLAHVQLSVFRALVGDDEPTAANDPDHEFTGFEWFDVSNGYPPELKDNLHHPGDAVGAMLRRRQ